MIRFRYQNETSSLGKIKRPIANVFLETTNAKIEAAMYIDSGADRRGSATAWTNGCLR